jgi:DNA-binding IclR family transcriptional regulator
VFFAAHRRLDYFEYRELMAKTIASDTACKLAAAARSLRTLTLFGYLTVEKSDARPRRYRITPPLTLSSATYRAA